jgi:hypothetical protein
VFVTQTGEFVSAVSFIEPARCTAAEGDCLSAIRLLDGSERFSAADSTDLAAREVIELEFSEPPSGRLGLVIASRQTLMSTYLFYQALAYMGESAGAWLAALERDATIMTDRAASVGRLLGGIDVLVPDATDGWIQVGYSWETGPLATDYRVVPLGTAPRDGQPLRVRLRMAKGLWRLDWIGLARLGEAVTPIRLEPQQVFKGGHELREARERLTDPGQTLVTLPGDEYTLIYRLPAAAVDYELFLESRGYYLEWMRTEWLAEEDPARAAMIFFDPAGALRTLAPEFKKAEPQLEDLFWRSRYEHH